MSDRAKGWWFVGGQFALLAMLIAPLGDPVLRLPGGLDFLASAASWLALLLLVVAGLGLGRALTAHPIPNQRGELVTNGMYRLVRHPIYTCLMAAALLMALGDASAAHLAAAVGLLVLLNFKARFEEAQLAQHYELYADYQARTGRFLPRFR